MGKAKRKVRKIKKNERGAKKEVEKEAAVRKGREKLITKRGVRK